MPVPQSTTPDLTHLNALELRLSHERVRLSESKTAKERELRAVWVSQIEREIAGEKKFLGIEVDADLNISDDELLAELMAGETQD